MVSAREVWSNMITFHAIMAGLRKAAQYAADHPVTTFIIGLLAALGIQRLRIVALERKHAQLKAKTEKAGVDLVLEKTRVAMAEADKQIARSDTKATAARASANANMDKAREAAADGREIDKRWPTRLVFLPAALAALSGVTYAQVCVPEEPSGLTDAMRDAAALLREGTDARNAIMDGVARIDAYRKERAGLCGALDGRDVEIAAAADSRGSLQRVIAMQAKDLIVLDEHLDAALNREARGGAVRFVSCGIGGHVGVGFDGEPEAGVSLSCHFPLFSK